MGNRTRPEDPADESRCTRTGKGWRCHNPRHPGRVYCERHHSLYLARLERTKSAKPSDPSSDAPKRPKKPPPPPPLHLVDDSLPPAPGQIWAAPAAPDALPRAYARLDRLLPGGAAAEVTPLDPADPSPPSHVPESAVPPSCGAFRPSGSLVVKEISSFSHRMIAQEERNEASGDSDTYTILPRRGEVWAIYHDWDDAEKRFVFRLVEVLSDLGEEDGVTVAALAPVEGSEEALGRHLYEGFELLRTFSRAELARFSHRIPVLRVDAREKDGASRGSWKIVLR